MLPSCPAHGEGGGGDGGSLLALLEGDGFMGNPPGDSEGRVVVLTPWSAGTKKAAAPVSLSALQ